MKDEKYDIVLVEDNLVDFNIFKETINQLGSYWLGVNEYP